MAPRLPPGETHQPVSRELDPRRLETFRVVATLGKISLAARALYLSQPAVTAQVRKLEAECGAPLFVRTPRGVSLNERGQALLVYAQRVRQALEEAAAAVLDQAPRGELVLAASTTVASYVLPPLLVGFCRVAPGVSIRMDVGNTHQVLEAVREGRAPLGLVEGHARAAGVRLQAFLADELCPTIGGPAAPPLAAVRKLRDLEAVPIIWREPGSGTRAVVERALRRAGSSRKWRRGDFQLASTEAIKTAVALGAGVGFLSRLSMRRELASGALHALALPGVRMERAFSWVLPADDLQGVAGTFVRFAAVNTHQLF